MLVREIFDQYRRAQLRLTRAPQRAEYAWKHLEPEFGSVEHDRVTGLIPAYVQGRSASRATVARELAVLSASLHWAYRFGLIGSCPFIPRLSDSSPVRSRVLTDEEIAALLRESAAWLPWLNTFIKLALLTGQRRNAIADLTWDRVDFNNGAVDFNDPNLKNASRAKGRGWVPMSSDLRDLLMELYGQQYGPYVLHHNGKQVRWINPAFRLLRKRVGIANATPHTLRHTVATRLVQKGVPIQDVQRLLGHRSVRTTEKVYVKYSPEFIRKAVEHLTIGEHSEDKRVEKQSKA
jgi:integrase